MTLAHSGPWNQECLALDTRALCAKGCLLVVSNPLLPGVRSDPPSPASVQGHLLGKNIAATLMLEALEVKSEERLHLMRPAISVCTRCTQRMR